MSGCVYSIDVQPPYSRSHTQIDQPLDLSISVGHNSNCFMDKCSTTQSSKEEKINQLASALLAQEEIFSAVQPMQSGTDLKIDFLHYPDVDSDITKREALYRDLMTITGIGLIPPIPFTFYLKTEHIARISAYVDGKEYYLKAYTVETRSRIKTAGILAARYKRSELTEAAIGYLIPVFIDKIKDDYPYYVLVQEAIREENVISLNNLADID